MRKVLKLCYKLLENVKQTHKLWYIFQCFLAYFPNMIYLKAPEHQSRQHKVPGDKGDA